MVALYYSEIFRLLIPKEEILPGDQVYRNFRWETLGGRDLAPWYKVFKHSLTADEYGIVRRKLDAGKKPNLVNRCGCPCCNRDINLSVISAPKDYIFVDHCFKMWLVNVENEVPEIGSIYFDVDGYYRNADSSRQNVHEYFVNF